MADVNQDRSFSRPHVFEEYVGLIIFFLLFDGALLIFFPSKASSFNVRASILMGALFFTALFVLNLMLKRHGWIRWLSIPFGLLVGFLAMH